jgi:hypothetical protein
MQKLLTALDNIISEPRASQGLRVTTVLLRTPCPVSRHRFSVQFVAVLPAPPSHTPKPTCSDAVHAAIDSAGLSRIFHLSPTTRPNRLLKKLGR